MTQPSKPRSRKRHPRAGLFNGYWTDLAGKKLGRVRRSEYPELYRLRSKHADIVDGSYLRALRADSSMRLGIQPIGFLAPWTVRRG